MQHFDPQQFLATLEHALPAAASGQLCVAFSGGLDSSVLLHAVVAAARLRPRYRIRAIYIDHQLQRDSALWHEHCAQVCRTLEIDYLRLTVTVDAEAGVGLEAAARTVRYAALRQALQSRETLLTAHHADDQLETVLLALLRGSGLKGLAAMPALRRFGEGWHARPLLAHTRSELEHYARAAGIAWIDDPSNQVVRFDRNYLREVVLPGVRARWPAAAHNVSRAASHAAEADQLLLQLAQADAERTTVESCLKVSAVAELPGPRRRNLLRYWLRCGGASTPSTRKLAALEHDMLTAGTDRLPCTEWDDFAVRRHRDLLYCTPRHLPRSCQPLLWDWSTSLSLGPLGCLRAVDAAGGLDARRLPRQVQVAYRPALEQLARSELHRVKKLLQRADVLPWYRDQVPLILMDGTLVAVADLWLSAKLAVPAGETGVRILWEDPPKIRTVRPFGQ